MDVVDLTGKVFDYLTVNKYVGLTGLYKCKKYGTQKGYHTWECTCKCGKVLNVRSTKLRNNTTKSCGCKKKTYKPNWTLPQGEAAKNLLFGQYKQSAKERGLDFSLTREEFIKITSSNCKYCGTEPSKSMALKQKGNKSGRSLNGDYLYNGIDRSINSEGYTNTNSVPCCWECNRLKSSRDEKDFIEHIRKIAVNYE